MYGTNHPQLKRSTRATRRRHACDTQKTRVRHAEDTRDTRTKLTQQHAWHHTVHVHACSMLYTCVPRV